MSNEIEYKNLWFHPETPEAVMNLISGLYNNVRIRLFYGDAETGKCWNDEYDVIGYIGRSAGSNKIPLLINNRRSMGGGGILTHCIIAIYTTEGTCLYKHPKFDVGVWTTAKSPLCEYHISALCDGAIVANFKTQKQADNYIGFMTGKRFCK